jgi:hypothetical protein
VVCEHKGKSCNHPGLHRGWHKNKNKHKHHDD